MQTRRLDEIEDLALRALLESVLTAEGISTAGDSYWELEGADKPIIVVPLKDAGDPEKILFLYYLPATMQHFFLQTARNASEANRVEVRLWSGDEASEMLVTEQGLTLLDHPSAQTFRIPQPDGRIAANALSPGDIIACIAKTFGISNIATTNWAQLIGSIGCNSTTLLARALTLLSCLSMGGVGVNLVTATIGCVNGVANLISCGLLNCSSVGTVVIGATLNGNSTWTGAVSCTLNGPSNTSITKVPATLSGVLVGEYTLQCSGGGPGVLMSITPSARQTLANNGTINFKLNYGQAVATPVITPSSGTYLSSVKFSASTSTAGATLRVTLNNTEPNASSPILSGSLTLTASTTVKVKAFKSGMADSATATATYTIKQPLTVACSAVPNPVRINQSITWRALPQNGSGAFSYQWLNGTTSATYTKSYPAAGTIANWVTVTDKQFGTVKTANCSLTVTK